MPRTVSTKICKVQSLEEAGKNTNPFFATKMLVRLFLAPMLAGQVKVA